MSYHRQTDRLCFGGSWLFWDLEVDNFSMIWSFRTFGLFVRFELSGASVDSWTHYCTVLIRVISEGCAEEQTASEVLWYTHNTKVTTKPKPTTKNKTTKKNAICWRFKAFNFHQTIWPIQERSHAVEYVQRTNAVWNYNWRLWNLGFKQITR